MRAAYLALLAMLMLASAPAAATAGGAAIERHDAELAMPHGARTISASNVRSGDPVRLSPFVLAPVPVVIPPPPVRAALGLDVRVALPARAPITCHARAPPRAPTSSTPS